MKKIIVLILLLMIVMFSGCRPKQFETTLDFESKNISVYVGEEFTLAPIVTNVIGTNLVDYVIENDTILSYEGGNVFLAIDEGTTSITATLKADTNITCVIQVTTILQEFTITYYLNGGVQTDAPALFGYSTLPLVLPIPTKEGFVFDGWYSSNQLSGAKIESIPVGTNANQTVYAKWIEQSYTITYHLDDGDNPLDAPLMFVGSNLPLALPTPTKTDYVFLGWFANSELTGEALSELPIGTNTNQTLYASWLLDADDYAITYHLDGGLLDTGAPASVSTSDLPLALPEPTRSGYVFVGWYPNTSFDGNYKEQITVSDNLSQLTYYARWVSLFTYSINYHLDGGVNSANNKTSYTIYDLPFTVNEPTKEGFTFDGWYVNPRFILDPVDEVDYAKNYVLYAKWVSVATDEEDIYIDASLSGTVNGTEVTYQGVTYVFGDTAFASLQAGLSAATGRVFLAGTFTENATINASDLTLLGPNAFIDPNKAVRHEEAVIKGVITVASGVNNLTMNGLSFTEGARIIGSGTHSNVQFMYNYIHNTQAPTAAWVEVAGYTSGFFVFANAANNLLNDFSVLNNKFDHVLDVNINFARVTNVLVDGNTFTNFERDAIRFDTGGFNQGDLTFINNIFANDVQQGFNGIFFRIYGGDEAKPTKILIENNTFKNIGQTSLTNYSGAISMRNFQEKVTTIEIIFNTFETCANFIHIRNNATVANNVNIPWIANVNFNIFKGIPTTYYYKNWTGSDTAATNPQTMNFEYNYFEDNDGNPIADMSAYAGKFFNVASYAFNYATFEDYDNMLREKTTGQIDVYVNHQWVTYSVDDAIEYDGKSLTFGTNAFASLTEALDNCSDGDRIYVLPGTYSEHATIRNDNITILTDNMNIDPNTEIRNAETVVTTRIDVVAGVSGLTINGLGFSGSGQIYALGGISDFTFMFNNYFNTTIGSGDTGLVFLKPDGITGATIYQHYRLAFMNNRFQATGNPRLINICSTEDLVVMNNHFETAGTIHADGVRVWRLTNTAPVIIEGNTFVNFMQYAFFVSVWTKASHIEITNNTFTNVMRAIDIRGYSGFGTVENKDIINIQYNTITNATSYAIQVNHLGSTATSTIAIDVNYNKFMDSIPTHYFYNSQAGTAANLDYNYFSEGVTPTASKLVGVASSTNNYAAIADVPVYETGDIVMPTRITITNPIASLSILAEHQIGVSILPSNTTLKRVSYTSSHPSIISVTADGMMTARKQGTATIRVTSEADPSVFVLLTVSVTMHERIELYYDGPGAIAVGNTLHLFATVHANTAESILWESSNTSIATVDQSGVVTTHSAGNVMITASISDTTLVAEMGLTVYGNEVTDDLLKYLISINTGVLLTQEVWYIGSDDGSADYANRVYNPVSAYYFDDITIIRNMLPTTRSNYSNVIMNSVEFITVHDTAGSGSGSTAQANSGWCTNASNTATSWHYTTGNDGVFQQLENNIKGFHAGDGSREFGLTDTGIEATTEKPIITINQRGFYVINGVESSMLAPIVAQINESGIFTTIGTNGNYWINHSYFNTSYRLIANHGGNNNSIGIETAVNNGSDVFLTWQKTAKLIAELLVDIDQGIDRVLYHNSFSGKPCPRTMMTAGLVGEFEKLVAAEYKVLTEFSDYTITFVSHDPTILGDDGRIVTPPLETTNVTYTITVSDGTISQSITLNALVPGQYNW